MALSALIRLLAQRPRIVPGTTLANWNSGVASSGLAGGDLFTAGIANHWCRLCDSYLVITGFNAAATITLRGYGTVAGVERFMWTDDYIIAGIVEDIIWISWFWDTQVYGQTRIELYSNQAADDGLTVTWEYRQKDW